MVALPLTTAAEWVPAQAARLTRQRAENLREVAAASRGALAVSRRTADRSMAILTLVRGKTGRSGAPARSQP